MLTLQITKIFPVGSNCGNKFEGIAYDGCYFYLTVPKSCQIYQYDNCFNQKKCISVLRGYTSICYDREYKCFWAIVENVHNKIFRLDMSLKEVDCITIQYETNCTGCITGLSCGYMPKKLLITFDGYVASVDKHSNAVPCILQKAGSGTKYTSVQGLCNYYIASFLNSMHPGLYLYSKTNELKLTCCIPSEYVIEDMTAVCSKESHLSSMPELYILAIKGVCYPYIIRCSIVCSDEENHCAPKADCCSKNCHAGNCHAGNCHAGNCHAGNCHTGNCHVENCHMGNCQRGHCQNRNCQNEYCKIECCYKDCCREPISGEQSCTDIIESVALIETAIAHVLNAEGEKIQKILAISDDPCEILHVNEAVNKTITHITHLENVLLSKLQLAKDMCPELCETAPCCDKKCDKKCEPKRDCDKKCDCDKC